MQIEAADFEEILPLWRDHLWVGRTTPIEPTNSITHEGGHDHSLKSAQHFFFKTTIESKIVGVISGIKTTSTHLRVRGIYVCPDWRRQKVGDALMKATLHKGKELGCNIAWSLPRRPAYSFYLSNQFKPIGDWFENEMEFGAHRYVERPL